MKTALDNLVCGPLDEASEESDELSRLRQQVREQAAAIEFQRQLLDRYRLTLAVPKLRGSGFYQEVI